MSAAGDRLQVTARKAALALPDVSHGRPFTPGLDVYKVADKVFLIVTDDPDEQIITVKCEPEHARALERGYASISPGRYLDKRHWISLGPGRGITKRLINDAVEHSYDLVIDGRHRAGARRDPVARTRPPGERWPRPLGHWPASDGFRFPNDH
ncbi:MmcQ/YjbR family DNA-binding protein [Streptomyces sp. NPDC048484]|uniref:MmcQ/YjbR family DNA-binding protein n=1 Tax=Streptomyces sp. NPDC048484 TaxID=3155146 RepID=UPI0034485407